MSDKKKRTDYGPTVRLAVISLVMCGLMFPIFVTGVAQVIFPYQANGELAQIHGRPVGSMLVAETFNSSMFFHADWASNSASGVDPDITLQDAYSQIPIIHNATGISSDVLKQIVDANVERTLFVAGDLYVNVLKLNLILIQTYPTVYQAYDQ
ncbi:MAG: potassium-transporting ATPase subunit C [Candidatus Bathyarchaeia archaeon]